MTLPAITWVPMPEEPPTEPTVYAVVTGNWGHDIGGVLIHADGEHGVSHVSSSESWLKMDLTTGFGDRAVALRQRYGDSLQAVYVPSWSAAPAWLHELAGQA